MGESQKITISFPKGEEYLLEEVDDLVEQGVYETRTQAFIDALDQSPSVDGLTVQYDAAVSALYEAERKNRYDLAENAKEHILENFSGSRMAQLLGE